MKGAGALSVASSRNSSIDNGRISIGNTDATDDDEDDDEMGDPMKSPNKSLNKRSMFASNAANMNTKIPFRAVTPSLSPFGVVFKNPPRSSSKPKDHLK